MDATDEPHSTTPQSSASSTYPTEQQRRLLWISLTALALTALLGVAALIFLGFIAFLSWFYPILLPIGLAVIIALCLEPFVGFAQKRGLRRDSATLLVCLLTVVAFLIFWAFLLPPLVGQAGDFFKSLPATLNEGITKLQATISTPLEKNPVALPTTTLPSGVTSAEISSSPGLPATEEFGTKTENGHIEIQAWLANNLPAIQREIQKNLATMTYSALGPVGQALGFLLGFGFVPIYVYYFLADQERIANHWHDYVPLRRSPLRDEVVSVLGEINQVLVNYFRGQIVVAACNGLLTFIGLWVIGVPYSLVLGVITGALSIVPFLGIIASIIPALLLGFLSAKGDPTWQWLTPVLVLGVFALVQMCESMFITPRVQSHTTGLHPLAIILGILFWSLLLPGLLGPIVAVPLTCAGVVVLRRYVWLERKAG
jgi:predicted PurR-regulated permease PerM